ncbi:MAG: GYD domain-containing protein [Thermoplasmata archaeon]|nr:GYD domain-containing protein [Thermoplasmata archaeon]
MPAYIALLSWTGQGVRNVRETTKRFQEGTSVFEQMGVNILSFHWTSGRYDAVAVSEAPDDETASAAALAIASDGNVRTETLRAYSLEDMERIIGKMP